MSDAANSKLKNAIEHLNRVLQSYGNADALYDAIAESDVMLEGNIARARELLEEEDYVMEENNK